MTGSFTIGAWIYNNGCDYTTIMSKRPGNNPYNGFHLSYEPGGNYDFIIHKDWTGWTGSQAIVSTPAISNEWVHMTAVFEAGQYVAIYINGSLMNQVSTNISSLSYANAPFLIGSLQYGGNWSWDGKIDNAFIFDKALTGDEINDIYNGCEIIESNLVGYWNFEEGNGLTVYDQTSNGNNGIITGATYSADVPYQACELTTVNGCDSVAVLNLTISGPDTSFINITACDSYIWNGITYTESGTYYYDSESVNNALSLRFNGAGDYISISDNPTIDISDESFSIEVWIKKDSPYNNETTAAIVGSRQPGSAR